MAEYETSGLSRVEFCRQHQLSLSTLARYRKRPGQTDAGAECRWLPVEVAGSGARPGGPASSGLAVALASGRRIEIGRVFDARTLTQLLSVLERG